MDTEPDPRIAYVEDRLNEGAHLIPAHMLDAIKRYTLDGVPPGGFLTALLANDFLAAAGRADDDNAACLIGWARFFYNYMPAGTAGSAEAFSHNISTGGVRGRLSPEVEAA